MVAAITASMTTPVPRPFLDFSAVTVARTTSPGGAISSWANEGYAGGAYSAVAASNTPLSSIEMQTEGGLPHVSLRHSSFEIDGLIEWETTRPGTGWTISMLARAPAQGTDSVSFFHAGIGPDTDTPGIPTSAHIDLARGEWGTADVTVLHANGSAAASCHLKSPLWDGNSWHTITVVATHEGMTVYKDGALWCNAEAQLGSRTTDVQYIGRSPALPAALMTADIRQLAVWLQPLSLMEREAWEWGLVDLWRVQEQEVPGSI
jgi:hypothetical protein